MDHFTRLYIIKVSNNYGFALCRANWKAADSRGWLAQNVTLAYFCLAQPMFELHQLLPMSSQTGELFVDIYFELPPHPTQYFCFLIPGLELAPGPSCRSHMSRGNACLLHKTQLSPRQLPHNFLPSKFLRKWRQKKWLALPLNSTYQPGMSMWRTLKLREQGKGSGSRLILG